MTTVNRFRAWVREMRAISAEIDRARLAHGAALARRDASGARLTLGA